MILTGHAWQRDWHTHLEFPTWHPYGKMSRTFKRYMADGSMFLIIHGKLPSQYAEWR